MVSDVKHTYLAHALADPNREHGYKTVSDFRKALLDTGLENWEVEDELQEMNEVYKTFYENSCQYKD